MPDGILKTLRHDEERIAEMFRNGIHRFIEYEKRTPEWEKERHRAHPPSKIKEKLQQIMPFLLAMNAANAITIMYGTAPELVPILFTGAEIAAFLDFLEARKEQGKAHEAYLKHLQYEKRKLKEVV